MNMTTKYRFVIEINENETAISPGDFYRMRQAGKFTMVKIDENDFAKIIGTTANGTIYVSERLDEEMTEKEEKEYYARKGVTEETMTNRLKPDTLPAGEYYIEGLTLR